MRRIFTAMTFSLMSSAVFATCPPVGGCDVGTTIVAVGVDTVNNKATIAMAANLSGGPSCGQNSPASVTVNLATTGGYETLGAAKLALALGSTVNVYGTGSCTIYSNVEDASSISVF